MRVSRIASYLAFVAVFAAHLLTGFMISEFSRIVRNYIRSEFGGQSLPAFTESFLPYGASSSPVIVGLLVGLLLSVSLCLIERSEKTREYLPFYVAVAFMLCLLHLATAWVAMTLPFVLLGGGMT
jgi:flagellar biosynthesis protein FliQ